MQQPLFGNFPKRAFEASGSKLGKLRVKMAISKRAGKRKAQAAGDPPGPKEPAEQELEAADADPEERGRWEDDGKERRDERRGAGRAGGRRGVAAGDPPGPKEHAERKLEAADAAPTAARALRRPRHDHVATWSVARPATRSTCEPLIAKRLPSSSITAAAEPGAADIGSGRRRQLLSDRVDCRALVLWPSAARACRGSLVHLTTGRGSATGVGARGSPCAELRLRRAAPQPWRLLWRPPTHYYLQAKPFEPFV